MESFSTRGLPAARKLRFWNEIASDTFAAMDVRPHDSEGFYGSLDRERLGALTVMNVYSSAVRIRHTREHIARMATPSYLLLTPLQREMELRVEGGASLRVRAGELCLLDHARAYDLTHGDDMRTLCVDVPRERLEARGPGAERLVGRLVRAESASARVLLGVLRTLGDEVHRRGGTGLSPAFGENLLGLVADAYSSAIGDSSGRGTQARAKTYRAYIESRLTDPELKPLDVASRFNVSERYLRAVLSSDGETFSAYLLRRRLAQCARLLRDPDWRRSTITELAFRCGFSNTTHFGQAFKAHYGLTPREYRSD